MFRFNNIDHTISSVIFPVNSISKNTICELRNRENTEFFAVKLKYLNEERDKREAQVFSYLREKGLKNNYIIKYFGHIIENNAKELLDTWTPQCFENPKTCILLKFELCEMNLKEWHQKFRPNTSLEKLVHIFTQLVIGVAFLHNNKIMHRNIQPENILINCSDNSRCVRLKIGGFGAAKVITDGDTGPDRMDVDVEHSLGPSDGLYWSPEYRNNKVYNQSVDIFPLGLIYVDLLYTRSFQIDVPDKISLFSRIKNKNYRDVTQFEPTLIDRNELKIIDSIIEENPAERLDAEEILHYLLPLNKDELFPEINLIPDILTQLNTDHIWKKARN